MCGSAAGVRRAAVLAPAPRTPSTDGDAVEDLALCRLEAGQTVGASRVAMVNIGWGLGQGGVTVHGTAGRAVAHYRADGTMPWAPFENLTVTTADGTRTVDLPAGEELGPLVANAMRGTVADLVDAITKKEAPAAERCRRRAEAAADDGTGRSQPGPAASGLRALHTLETTVAAYASAALGRTVAVPLPTDGPLHNSGVIGMRDLTGADAVPADSPVRRRGLFGLTPAGA